MLEVIQNHWKKEYLLIAVAVVCLIIYYYRKELSKSENNFTQYLPIVGGLAFGFNTLINLTK